MFLAILLAGVCAWQPDYSDFGGPVCTLANQAIECRCSECMTWDSADCDDTTSCVPSQKVTYYDVERTNPDGSYGVVGGTWRIDWLEEDNSFHTQPASTIWCPAKEIAIPREGLLYGYRVKACNVGACGGWSNGIEYMGAPYAIDHFQPPGVDNP